MTRITAILNDMDGMLVNSEQLYLEANQLYFKQFGINFTAEMHAQGTGRKFDVWMPTFFPELHITGEGMLAGRNIEFFKLAEKHLELLPGVKEYLEMVSKNFKNALVTSSRPDYLDIVFRKTGIHTCFDLVVDASMVQTGKPDPECYLMAAKMLDVDPSECLVFEDAPAGVMAGKAAGMKVVNIPSPYVVANSDLLQADYRFDDIRNIDLSWISQL
jgi:HAD superfamily hydrolase (TIGR01509 family)